MFRWIKAWWQVYVIGITTPPEGEEKSVEELLKGYDDEEWEDAD